MGDHCQRSVDPTGDSVVVDSSTRSAILCKDLGISVWWISSSPNDIYYNGSPLIIRATIALHLEPNSHVRCRTIICHARAPESTRLARLAQQAIPRHAKSTMPRLKSNSRAKLTDTRDRQSRTRIRHPPSTFLSIFVMGRADLYLDLAFRVKCASSRQQMSRARLWM